MDWRKEQMLADEDLAKRSKGVGLAACLRGLSVDGHLGERRWMRICFGRIDSDEWMFGVGLRLDWLRHVDGESGFWRSRREIDRA
jgi:hypothetical protein